MRKNFRIPQPKELNLCDFCFNDIISISGSFVFEKYYSFCSEVCKNNFLIEVEDFLRNKDNKIQIFKCNWCYGKFKYPLEPIIENNEIFCSQLCSDINFGRKDPFYWRGKN